MQCSKGRLQGRLYKSNLLTSFQVRKDQVLLMGFNFYNLCQ